MVSHLFNCPWCLEIKVKTVPLSFFGSGGEFPVSHLQGEGDLVLTADT
jgi:hypothetical protein